MSALVKAEQPAEMATSILQVIANAANNPQVDIEKMERLLAMQERIMAKSAESQYNEAMTAAQGEMGRVSADAENKQTRSNYASYGQLDRHLRPIYTRHGFSLSFGTGENPPPDHVAVVCDVAHTAGFSKRYRIDMPSDGKGAKGGDVMTKTHASGAAVTYGMRYLLKMIFNVAIGEDDTDGNMPSDSISDKQLAELEAKISEVGANRAQFLKYLKVENLTQLPAAKFNAAVQALNDKAKGAK